MSSSRMRWLSMKRIFMAKIATLKKINLRDVWQDEGQFSDWLAANLSRLGD